MERVRKYLISDPKPKKRTIKELLYKRDYGKSPDEIKLPDNCFLLDEKNAIIINKGDEFHIARHYRLIDEYVSDRDIAFSDKKFTKLIKEWKIPFYHIEQQPLNGTTLFYTATDKEFTSNKFSYTNGRIYDYVKAKFLFDPTFWENISIALFEQYQVFLGSFTLASDKSKKFPSSISWEHPLTKKRITYQIEQKDIPYFAILELDGSIRGNKLFQGNSFSEITNIIDLDEYGSLDEFVLFRKKVLNEQRDLRKLEYDQRKQELQTEYATPYLDNEVMKLVRTRKK